MTTPTTPNRKAARVAAVPSRERARADARMERLREAVAARDRANADFEKAVLAAFERRGQYTAEEVAAAAGWQRARLYQFLGNRAA